MRMRSVLAWIAIGLVGLVLAAGVSYAATQLSSQRIGLSAEPPSAGEELAPPQRGAHRRGARTPTRGSSTVTSAPAGGGHGDPGEERREGGGDLDD